PTVHISAPGAQSHDKNPYHIKHIFDVRLVVMLSAVKRYKLLVSGALARCFPRTSAHLRSEEGAVLFRRWSVADAKQSIESVGKPKARAPRKPSKPRAKPRKPASEGIYGPARMTVDNPQIQAMRLRVGKAVEAGVICAPSDEPWAMIRITSPFSRNVAGAGSGKSTTLGLRVVFMLCHMEIPPERLTVISFTYASCMQLREQLLQGLGFWNFAFDPVQARRCVRTFHSAMGVLAKDVLGDPRWFEQLDEKGASTTE